MHERSQPAEVGRLEWQGDDLVLRVNVTRDPCAKAALVAYTTALRWFRPEVATQLRRDAGLPWP
ncbi:MAG: hypothetical protein AB7P99_15475 [Vicinamibacterales bacterium]